MCGIAGFINNSHVSLDVSSLNGLSTCIAHRGPDDQGTLIWDGQSVHSAEVLTGMLPPNGVLLYHRRLSILDLEKTGWQPMSNEDGRYHIIFNGEIYNYLELRDELTTCGFRFRSNSDTEVLLHAFAHWGVDCLKRLTGMFAFALLDTVHQTVILTRDFFGIKPLYYTVTEHGIGFSSELKSILMTPGVSRKVNADRAYMYLRHGVTDYGSETMLDGINQVPPGHFMLVQLKAPAEIKVVKYFDFNRVKLTQAEISFEEAASRLQELFLESVSLHMRSDVPIGAALSGGIDSSAVVMSMRHLLGDKLNLHAFSFINPDSNRSEEAWIDVVAKASGATVHKTTPTSEELVHDLKNLSYFLDEPFGSTSIYAQNRVFRLAKQSGVTVMLDGQGADELLGGYGYFLAARAASLLKHGRYRAARSFLRNVEINSSFHTKWCFKVAMSFLVPSRLQTLVRRLIGENIDPSWLNTSWLHERGVRSRVLLHPEGGDLVDSVQRITLGTTSLPHLLRYEDRNSMAYAIESRVPFLTPTLANFILGLPSDYVVSDDGITKAVFRKAMRGIVPDVILDRRDKIGFETPQLQWLLQLKPWVDDVLNSESARSVPLINVDSAKEDWELVIAGKRRFDSRLWRWLNFLHWVSEVGVEFV